MVQPYLSLYHHIYHCMIISILSLIAFAIINFFGYSVSFYPILFNLLSTLYILVRTIFKDLIMLKVYIYNKIRYMRDFLEVSWSTDSFQKIPPLSFPLEPDNHYEVLLYGIPRDTSLMIKFPTSSYLLFVCLINLLRIFRLPELHLYIWCFYENYLNNFNVLFSGST
jgi:hypothetical protein